MANPELVEQLKQDVESWNTWKIAHQEALDLTGANLCPAWTIRSHVARTLNAMQRHLITTSSALDQNHQHAE